MSLIDNLRCPKCKSNSGLEYDDIVGFDDDNRPILGFHCYNCNIDLTSKDLIEVVLNA